MRLIRLKEMRERLWKETGIVNNSLWVMRLYNKLCLRANPTYSDSSFEFVNHLSRVNLMVYIDWGIDQRPCQKIYWVRQTWIDKNQDRIFFFCKFILFIYFYFSLWFIFFIIASVLIMSRGTLIRYSWQVCVTDFQRLYITNYQCRVCQNLVI